MKKLFHAVMLLGLLVSQFNAPMATRAQEPATPTTTVEDTTTPAPSETAVSETPAIPIDTPETPTPSETPIVTEIPSETATVTPEPSATATEGPTEEPSATPTIETPTEVTPTATASVTPTGTPGTVQLSMTPTPAFVTPGGAATLHWLVEGIDPATHALALKMALPAGIAPQDGEGTLDPATGVLWVPVGNTRGQFHLLTDELTADATFPVTLAEGNQDLATTQVTIFTHEEFTVGTGGGTVSAMGGKVKIIFPDGALPEDAKITVGRPDKDNQPESSLSGRPFEIKARGLHSNSDLHEFPNGIRIQANYADFGVEPGYESQLYVWWYNPETQDWAALPSHADPQTGIVTGTTTHFSTFDISVNNWQASLMPSVDAFQVSQFTGAATYSLPIQVPEGPGGLKPDLTLSYNSQVVDQSTTYTQPDWVGMGWSLDTGSILLDEHGNSNYADDSWLLSVGGVSTRIVLSSDGYHAMDENYWKIVYNAGSDLWTVYDKIGNTYTFAYALKNFGDKSYKWMLTSVTNVFDRSLTYAYSKDTKYVMIDGMTKDSDTAVYPTEIVYPDGRQRIRFVRELRADFQSDWFTDAADRNVELWRLKEIFIEENHADNGWVQVRKYSLQYVDIDGPNIIFPGHHFSGGGQAATLKSVTMYGTGVESLPATTFTYDGVHLTRADNGYGGAVLFAYEKWPATTAPRYFQRFDDANSKFVAYGPWQVQSGTGSVYVAGDSLYVQTATTAQNTSYDDRDTRTGNNDRGMVRPGGRYRVIVNLNPLSPSIHGRVGMAFVGTTISWACAVGTDCLSGTFDAPFDSSKAIPYVRATNGTIRIKNISYQLLPTFYRVHQKTILDGQNHSYEYGYDYPQGSASLNTDANSPCTRSDGSPCTQTYPTYPQDSDTRYFPLYSEFRGHSEVTETAPDGSITITKFYQTDALKGRPYEITVQPDAVSHINLTKTLIVYNGPELGAITYPQGFDDLHRRNVKTASEENRTYSTDGTFSATFQTYSYDNYGNVISQDYKRCNPCSADPAWPTRAVYKSTLTDYYPNTSGGKNLVGLPARVRVTGASGTLAQTLNLYDGHDLYTDLPTTGTLKDVRTWTDALGPGGANRYSQVSYSYDGWGNRTTVTTYAGYGTVSTDAAGPAFTTYTCYGDGNTVGRDGATCSADGAQSVHALPLWTKDATGHFTSWTYFYMYLQPATQKDVNGATTEATYDPFGRIKSLKHVEDGVATLSMCYKDGIPFQTGITQVIETGLQYSVFRTYDGMGREVQTDTGGTLDTGACTNQGGVHTQTKYPFVNKVEKYTPYEGTTPSTTNTSTLSDPLGRPTTIKATDDTVTGYTYNGLVTTVKDARLNSTITTKDPWGRVSSVTPPTGPAITYTYDELDRLVTATRGGAQTTLTYDPAGRKISMNDPDMGYWTYAYDALGNLASQTDARGCQLTMGYDALNRLTSKSPGITCSTQTAASYTYDQGTNGIGRRTSMSAGPISDSWTYDERGRVKTQTQTITGGGTFLTQWAYNYAGLPASMTYPDGEIVNSTYNNRMQLQTLGNPPTNTTYVASAAYDLAGRLTSQGLGSQLIQKHLYYGWSAQGGRLDKIVAGTGEWDVDTSSFATNVQKLDYDYDPVGNVTYIADLVSVPGGISGELQSFQYDTLNRLTNAGSNATTEQGGYNQAYEYDPTTGNLSSKAGTTYFYNDSAHPHAVTDVGTNQYGYDANGNMISRPVNGSIATLNYDAENRLVKVCQDIDQNGLCGSGDTQLASFVYDADGNRVQSTIGAATTTFVGNYYETDGTTVTKYYYAGAQRIAMRKDGTLNFLLSDQLGSTTVTISEQGVELSRLRYKAWGEVRIPTSGVNPGPSDYTYTGQYSNVEDFGLIFYNARWYDPVLGRFAQADTVVPEGVQGYDRYAYVNNAPMNNTDPTGHWECEFAHRCSHSGAGDDDGISRRATSISACKDGAIACGTVVQGQQQPTGMYEDFAQSIEDTFTNTSSGGALYTQPTSFQGMTDVDLAVYAGNWLQVLNDQLRAYQPVNLPVNVVVTVDWQYQRNSAWVTGVHVVNYTDTLVRINNVSVYRPAPGISTFYPHTTAVGHHGSNPGVLDYPLKAGFSRNESVLVVVWVKAVNVAYPIPSQFPVSGTGMPLGVTQSPSTWIWKGP